MSGESRNRVYRTIHRLDRKDSEKWIDVEYRLPDTDRDVFVYDNLFGRVVGYYNYKRWFLHEVEVSYEPQITHWRELPDPPKVDGEDVEY